MALTMPSLPSVQRHAGRRREGWTAGSYSTKSSVINTKKLFPLQQTYALERCVVLGNVSGNHTCVCVIPRFGEVPGMFRPDPARPEDRVRRGHPGGALPSAHQGEEERLPAALSSLAHSHASGIQHKGNVTFTY